MKSIFKDCKLHHATPCIITYPFLSSPAISGALSPRPPNLHTHAIQVKARAIPSTLTHEPHGNIPIRHIGDGKHDALTIIPRPRRKIHDFIPAPTHTALAVSFFVLLAPHNDRVRAALCNGHVLAHGDAPGLVARGTRAVVGECARVRRGTGEFAVVGGANGRRGPAG
jgi:hypothetical protein